MADDPAVEAFLGLGGNIGDVTDSFVRALRFLADSPGVALRRISSIYRTPPWGKLDQPSFFNMAALIETTLPARTLLDLCLGIERKMGRRRLARWGPRTLDIDILTYGDLSIDEPDLQAPHPRIVERAPLAEIAPRLRIAGRDIASLLALADRAGIEVEPLATRRAHAALASTIKNS